MYDVITYDVKTRQCPIGTIFPRPRRPIYRPNYHQHGHLSVYDRPCTSQTPSGSLMSTNKYPITLPIKPQTCARHTVYRWPSINYWYRFSTKQRLLPNVHFDDDNGWLCSKCLEIRVLFIQCGKLINILRGSSCYYKPEYILVVRSTNNIDIQMICQWPPMFSCFFHIYHTNICFEHDGRRITFRQIWLVFLILCW